jgi:hypothetical protein
MVSILGGYTAHYDIKDIRQDGFELSQFRKQFVSLFAARND